MRPPHSDTAEAIGSIRLPAPSIPDVREMDAAREASLSRRDCWEFFWSTTATMPVRRVA